MDNQKYGLHIFNQTGDPYQAGDYELTPQSQAIVLRLPFGSFVHNRPVAVLVKKDGRIDRLPIVDVTRRVLMGLAVFSLVFTLLLAGRTARRAHARRK